MKKWLQRIRGAIGMGVTWAVAWFGVGAVLGLVLGGAVGVGAGAALGSLFAGLGFGAGAAFSAVLALAEGRHRFDEMSLPRFAGWGALGGLLLCLGMFLVFGSPQGGLLGDVITVGVVTLLAAGSAAGSLALARRAEDRDLLEAGEEALGLTEGG